MDLILFALFEKLPGRVNIETVHTIFVYGYLAQVMSGRDGTERDFQFVRSEGFCPAVSNIDASGPSVRTVVHGPFYRLGSAQSVADRHSWDEDKAAHLD